MTVGCIIWGSISGAVFGQETYLLKDLSVPQIIQDNPALTHPYLGHCALPGFGKINVGGTSFVNYGQIWHINNTLDKYMTSQHNGVGAWFSMDIIDFGFRVKDANYFTVFSNLKAGGSLNVNKDLTNFLLKGNANYEGKTMKFVGDDLLNFNLYAEFGVGYQREINENISFGINGKYIAGLYNLHTTQASVDFYTADNFEKLTVGVAAEAKMAGAVDLLPLFNYLLDTHTNKTMPSLSDMGISTDILKNISHGFGIDLGFRYKVCNWFEFDIAATDIGYIHWKGNAYQANIPQKEFDFTGVGHDDIFEPHPNGMYDTLSFDNFFSALYDSVRNLATLDTFPIESYNRWLNTRINLSTYFYATERDRFNLTFNGVFMGGKTFVPSGSISYSRQCGRWFEFVIGNTFKTSGWLNPGLGFNLRSDYFLFYCVVDYINNPVYYDKMRNVNVVLGINFLAGRRDKAKVKTPSFMF